MSGTSTPIPQADTVVFGRIAAVREVAGEPGVTEVDVRASLPDRLREVMEREKRPLPALDQELLVRVRVSAETLCVADMRAVDLAAFQVGEEVTAVPRPGSSAMVGTTLLLLEAAELYRFPDYQLRALPRTLAALPAEVALPDDPRRVNSAGTERSPLPLAGGRVVYLAAGLLPPLAERGTARGAVRAGMTEAGGALAPWAAAGGYRPYRVAWTTAGWGVPEPVALTGLAPDESARVTWVDEAETSCLLEVERPGGERALLAASRAASGAAWGALAPVTVEGGGSVGDAQRFGSRGGALVWTLYDAAGSDLWLSLQGQAPGPVDPRINTLGPEWAPRVGPRNALYFCRAGRQLVFSGGAVEEVRLPGAQLRPLLEAAPTADGRALFFRVPRFVPGEPDWDIAVAERGSDGRLGSAVALDAWRPAA